MDDDEISLSSTVGETHDSDEEWVAEGIIAEGFMDDQTKYLVEWTGFPLHEATWEPVSHLNETLLREWEEKKAKVKRGEEPKFRIKRWRDAAANHLRARHLRHERRNARRAKEGLETEDWEPSLKERIEVLDETTPKDSDNDDSDEESVDFDRLDHPPPAPASQPAKTRPSPTRREPPPPVTHEQTRRIVTIRVPGKPPPRSSAASASATNTNADTTTTTTNKAGASTNNTITHGASTNNRTTTTTNTPPVAASGATKIHNVIPPASAPQPRQGAPAFKSSTDDMSRPGASTPTGGRSSTVVPRKAPTVKSAIKSSNKTAKAATSNVFVSRKQRKPSTHTPNPHNLFFGRRSNLNGGDDRAPAQLPKSMINLDKRNLAPLDVSVGSSQKPKQDAPAPAPAPQKGSPNADPNAMAVDEPTPSSATRTEPPAPLPPALVRRDTRSGRRKSVRWVDEDQVMPSAVDSPEDSIFVSDETQRPASALDVASPSEIPRPPTPPRGYKKASQAGGASQEGAKQSVPVLCLVGNKSAKPTMFVFKGIPQQAAHPWLQDFQSRQSLTFRHTCTAANFGSQFRGERASLFPNLAQGSVFALSDAAALDSLYLWLKLPARGLMFYADTYCVLAFPADAPEWGLEAPDVSRTDGPLKFIVFEHQFSEFDLETRTDEKAICHDHPGWESWLPRGLGSFSAFESQTVLPPNTPPTARPQVFLAFPPGAIEESRLVAQWFPIASRSECVIYDSLSPGTWAEFLKAGHGAIVVHEDALWKIRLFPGMFDILDQAASGKYVISVFRRGCGGNEVTAEWSAGRPVTGDVSIQPIFPAGKAFFMTPSFIVTQPQQANLFVGFFVKSYGGPEATHRGVLIVPADFEDWLVDLIVERSKKPVNKDKETHKRDMMALDRLLEYVSRLDAPTSEEDMGSPLVYAPKTLDASDEQSLVNWFGWWTMANMNHIGRFYVIGSRAEPADRATRQLRIVNYHSKEPDVDPKGTTKNIPEGPSRRLPESPVRRPSQSRILRDDALETIREHLFVLSDRMHKTFHLMLFYYIPVTHWDVEKDWLKGARNRDYGASYKQWFDYYFPFDPARPAAETKNFNNTYGGFFYTSEDGRDTTELEGRDRDGGRGRNGRAVATLRPWLAFFRPVNPHRKPWREVELMILDTGYQGKIGCNDEVHEEQLIEAQRHLLAVVNQRNRDKNPHMPLTKVWLGGWDDNLVSDYTDPLDKTLAHLERCVAEVRVWLPAPANSLESRGWKLVREAGTAPQRDGSEPMDLDTDDEHGGHPAGRSQKTTRNSGKSGDDDGFGDEDDDDDDDVSQDGSDVDYVSRKKRVFAAPRRRTDPGAPGSLCTNALFQRCKGAKERRDTTMQYTYPATKAWYEKQVAEGRDYKHIMVDSWDKVFVKLHLPVNEA